jgi:hypothetical protein
MLAIETITQNRQVVLFFWDTNVSFFVLQAMVNPYSLKTLSNPLKGFNPYPTEKEFIKPFNLFYDNLQNPAGLPAS